MFKKVIQSIVNQMDPGGDLVPVPSILDNERFQPLCLVRRKRKTVFQSAPCYKRTLYRLEDVLLPAGGDKSPGSLLPSGAAQASQQFTIQKTTTDRVDGSLNITLDFPSMVIKGAASSSKVWTIKLQKNHIPMPQIEAVKAERKVNMQHPFIQQLQREGQNLYLIHESIETSEEANYQESIEADGSFMAQLYAKFCAKGAWESKQSITIPKGCTLAFRALQLAISDGPWGLDYLPARKRSTFVSDKTRRHQPHREVCVGSIAPSSSKFKALKTEVQGSCGVLHLSLAPDLPATVLKAIKAVMRDRNLFEELSHRMDAVLDGAESCELQTAIPDLEELLSILEHSPERSGLAEAIAYTLDALEELKEDQLLLLLEALDKKMVSQHLQMISGILAQEEMRGLFNEATFLLPASQEEQALITAMFEKSGITLQEDGSASWPEEAFPALAALYASLYVLDLLSNPEQVMG